MTLIATSKSQIEKVFEKVFEKVIEKVMEVMEIETVKIGLILLILMDNKLLIRITDE